MSLENELEAWLQATPYVGKLGLCLERVTADSLRLRLPFCEQNTNPGQALHGGVAASVASIAGQALTRATLGVEAAPCHTTAIQVSYLAAAIGEDVFADARLLRRGKEICFVDVSLETAEGKPIAHTLNTVRGWFGAAAEARPKITGDHGHSDPGKMGPHIGRMPFTQALGLYVEHMAEASSRITLPYLDSNASSDAGVHEGAVLALLDTTGAMASWAETGPGPYKASTPSLQAQILGPPPAEGLVAFGRLIARDQTTFWAAVDVATSTDMTLVARGTVLYRILT